MPKKEKLNLQRTDDFYEVDNELTEAMDVLDSANARISSLLDEYHPAEDEEEAAPEQPEGEPQQESPPEET